MTTPNKDIEGKVSGDKELWDLIVNYFPAFEGEEGEQNKRSLFEQVSKLIEQRLSLTTARLKELDTLFQSLTPQGSEFVNNPEKCIESAKREMKEGVEAKKAVIKLKRELTTKPLDEKEVERILLNEFDKRGRYFKAEINNVAKAICSHFSKPKLKLPTKPEYLTNIEDQYSDVGSAWYGGFDYAMNALRQLNGEGGI